MRYAFVAAALFASALAMPGATITKYQTVKATITSCAPEVTNCPNKGLEGGAPPTYGGESTPSKPVYAPESTTSCTEENIPTSPAETKPVESYQPPMETWTTPAPPAETSPVAPP